MKYNGNTLQNTVIHTCLNRMKPEMKTSENDSLNNIFALLCSVRYIHSICTFFLDITGSIYFQQFSEVDTSQEHTGYLRIDFKGIAL